MPIIDSTLIATFATIFILRLKTDELYVNKRSALFIRFP